MQGGWLPLAIGASGIPADDHMEKGPLPSAQERAANAFAQRPYRLDDRTRARVQDSPRGCLVPRCSWRGNLKAHQSRSCTISSTTACFMSATLCSQSSPIASHTSRKMPALRSKISTHGFFRIIAHFGFMETPTIGEVIECCAMKDFVIEEQKTSFFLGRETIICTGKPGMARWREHLFVAMSRHAQRPAEFFKLPVNRIVELGGRVEI